jgi:hypothetical protein
LGQMIRPVRTILRLRESQRRLLQQPNPPLHSRLCLTRLPSHFLDRHLMLRDLCAFEVLLLCDFGHHSQHPLDLRVPRRLRPPICHYTRAELANLPRQRHMQVRNRRFKMDGLDARVLRNEFDNPPNES